MPTTLPEIPSTFTLDDVALLLGILLAAIAGYLITRRLLTRFVARLAVRHYPKLAAQLERQRFWPILALLAPALVVLFSRPLVGERSADALEIIGQLLRSYVIVVLATAIHKGLGAFDAVLGEAREPSVASSFHGIFRWLQIANFCVASVLVLGVFANVQVAWVLALLGVIAAAGSIVFGDLIYNAVARAFLKGRELVVAGDWLEIPALEINGEVKEVGPVLIEVQNWDNSLATVPPRYLLTNTFRNWRRMYEVGTRRIRRFVYIDVATVRLAGEVVGDELRARPEIAPYLEQRAVEYGSAARALATLTNAALFRIYFMGYLTAHPKVSKDSIIRVTNEDSIGQGLPLLIIAYLTETADVAYRLLDAEIYEHALAVAPQFGLRLFQAPAGVDLRTWHADAGGSDTLMQRQLPDGTGKPVVGGETDATPRG